MSHESDGTQRDIRPVVVACAAMVALIAAITEISAPALEGKSLAVLALATPAVGALGLALAGMRRPATRKAWLWFALGSVLWVAQTQIDLAGMVPAAPTAAKVSGMVVACYSVIWGMMQLPRLGVEVYRRRQRALDALMIELGTMYMFWLAFEHYQPIEARTVYVFAPLTMAAVVGGAAVVMGRCAPGYQKSVSVMCAGATALAFGGLGGVSGNPLVAGVEPWAFRLATSLGMLLVLLSTQLTPKAAAVDAEASAAVGVMGYRPRVSLTNEILAPFLIAAGIFGGIITFVVKSELSTISFAGLVSLMGLSLLRQTATLSHNRELASSLGASMKSFQYQATHDSLTGLANRPHLLDWVNAELTRDSPGQLPVTLFFVDIDKFKDVNDSLGHDQGDLLLCQIADRLFAVADEGEVVARLGGDEFVVVSNTLDAFAAEEKTAAILDALSEPYRLEGAPFLTSASIGYAAAERDPAHRVDPADRRKALPVLTSSQLMRNADLALYEAKEDGRGRARAFRPDLLRNVERRANLGAELQQAVRNEELEIHYQPIICGSTKRVEGAEALLRWPHKTRGLLDPSHFLHLAEDLGLLTQVGQRTLQLACAYFANLNAELDESNLKVHVNLSRTETLDSRLLPTVRDALANSGLAPSNLILEITEDVVADEGINARLSALRDLGVELSVDDFGTGYSSLADLHQFPASELKIDRKMLENIETSKPKHTIAKAIVELGHGLGLTVVAQGIETSMHERIALEMGCDSLQGFFYGMPQTPEELSRFISRNLSKTKTPSRPKVDAPQISATLSRLAT